MDELRHSPVNRGANILVSKSCHYTFVEKYTIINVTRSFTFRYSGAKKKINDLL